MAFGMYVSPKFPPSIDIFSFKIHLVKEPNAEIICSVLFHILDLINYIDGVLTYFSPIYYLDIASSI